MRFTHPSPFYRHLASPASSRLYIVAGSDDFERRNALRAALAKENSGSSFVTAFLPEEAAPSKILDALNCPMLFGGEPFVIVEEADKKLFDALHLWMKDPEFGYLFIGSKGKAPPLDHAVILDMTEEKPWDKAKRFQQELQAKAAQAGVRLDPAAAEMLIERLDTDSALLAQELNKLLLYAAERRAITTRDVEAASAASRSHTFWQIADALVWDRVKKGSVSLDADPSFAFALITSLRQQLRTGVKMCDLLSSGVPFAEWGGHFPKLRPKALEQKGRLAQERGGDYFRKGLEELFRIEYLAKGSSVPLDALFDLLHLKLASHAS